MGMVMELYSVDPRLIDPGEEAQPGAESIRRAGTFVGNLSINSVAIGETCQWMLQTLLAPLVEIQAGSSTSLLVEPHDIAMVIEQVNKAESPTTVAISNAISDAAEEVLWRDQILGIVMS
jgi:hypothetical protein